MFTYLLLPNTFVFLGLEFMLTKFYVASFLAMLNARERKVKSTRSYADETIDCNSLAKQAPVSSGLGWGSSPIAANISLTSQFPNSKFGASHVSRPSDATVAV
jgi:hypothetical protein